MFYQGLAAVSVVADATVFELTGDPFFAHDVGNAFKHSSLTQTEGKTTSSSKTYTESDTLTTC